VYARAHCARPQLTTAVTQTFEPEDLAKAISYCKDALTIANLLRKPAGTVASFGRFVRGSGASTGTMASMTKVQRHAELVYAESLLLKAIMGSEWTQRSAVLLVC
jgi:hypothetical protein